MKVANNMDSVFAGSTNSELDFDVMFDEDDCLIDLVAGVNEMGEYVTGPNPEDNYEYQLDENGNPLNEEDDPITDKCDTGRREGELKDAGEAPEGTKKDADEEFESPEGMKSEIPGSANSAESKADDTKAAEDAIKEEDDPITDKDSEDLRSGKEKDASDNVEGEKQEVIGAALEEEETCPECGETLDNCKCKIAESFFDICINEFDSSKETDDTFEDQLKGAKEDPITDKESDELRSGKEKDASDNVEGEKQEVIGAAQEGADCEGCGDIDKELSKSDGMNDATIPDSIQTDGSANEIPVDAETQSSDGVEPASEEVVYTGWRNVTEAENKVALSSDDADIEAVDNGEFDSDSELDLDVDYDDDELIDIAINGGEI